MKGTQAKYEGKRVAVIGLGVSNLALIRYLTRQGALVTGRDRKGEADFDPQRLKLLKDTGIGLKLGEGYLEGLDQVEAVFVTPGMRRDFPQLLEAKARGTEITSEMKLFFSLCPVPILAITGSSGKTTTTTLAGKIMEASGRRVYVGGNIGQPLIERVEEIQPGDAVVLELSSFQLQELEQSPHIAVITNITPNHLDQHASMEEYIQAKTNIIRYQGEGDYAVLNLDNEVTRGLGDKASGRTTFFTRRGELEEGAYLEGEDLVWRWEGHKEIILPRGEILLRGEHNVENVLAAIAATRLYGASSDAIRQVVRDFRGVAHRLELVREKDGVAFFNDSIATSPARAIAGLRSFDQPLVLIAGGYDKHLPFDELGEEALKKVKTLVLLGATADKIEEAVHRAEAKVGGHLNIIRAGTFEEAVKQAAAAAKPGDVVLLSPACASYDMFPNFERRGEKFRELVRAMA